jgi:hypothetical protein
VKTSSAAWKQGGTDLEGSNPDDPYASGSTIHGALDSYNNTGVIDGIEYCCDRDNADALFALAQISQTL